MIEITQHVDLEHQTVTWQFKDTGPEHEIDGKMCHAIDGDARTTPLEGVMIALGYRYVCMIERPGPSWDPEPRRTHYWEPPT